MTAGAALATFLLCVATNLLAFGLRLSVHPEGYLVETPIEYLGFFSGRDARLITALALALLVVPTMAFLHQVSRLAAATRNGGWPRSGWPGPPRARCACSGRTRADGGRCWAGCPASRCTWRRT